MKNEIPRKVRRQIERHLAKQNKKDTVKEYNLSYEANKFFETEEGIEYYNELLKLYTENKLN